MKTNRLSFLTMVLTACLAGSCNKYLDIVPDNVATIEMAFNTKIKAKQFLFTCYAFLPDYQSPHVNPALFGGDELTCYTRYRDAYSVDPWYIQRGTQTASLSRCNFWEGKDGGHSIYRAIRDCNIFLENVDRVMDMDQWEKDQWKAEATFLKAYYHFYLTRMYGPIPIVDKNLSMDATPEQVHVYRNTLDECFDYIVNTLDKVIDSGDLPDVITMEASELGRITQGIALALKAEVLVYAASPLYNGNTDYRNLTDNRGIEIFCPEKTEAERLARWEKAAAACKEAIDFLEGHGCALYESEAFGVSDDTKHKLTIRGAFSEPWNCELIWGYTRTRVRHLQFQAAPHGMFAITSGTQGNASGSLKMAEMFYTKNGLPIDMDATWEYEARFSPRKSTDAAGRLMRSGYTSIGFNFDREYRYYADLAFDGGIWYQAGSGSEASPLYVQSKFGQPCAYVNLDHYNQTGFWIKKWLNPNTTISQSNNYWSYIDYPWPIMRLAGLYLYYAEALNECGEDYGTVLPWIDAIRERAGIPDVATSWDQYSVSPGRYKTKDGLREIIHRERTIELAFEGQRFWDLRRWKEAYTQCNQPFCGWYIDGETVEDYYQVTKIFNQTFEIRDYFWPIPKDELIKNTNLVQNYGWK